MIAGGLEGLAVPLDRLSFLPNNPRRGDVDAVARSLDTFGQRKPIVAKRDGTVIAGNHTLQAARQLGWGQLAVVFVDDDETTAKAFALADNRTAELGGYDEGELAALIGEVGEVDAALLAAAGWSDDAVAALLASLEPEMLPAQIPGDPDDVPDQAPGKTVPGDVWLLGPHRLLCGDSSEVSAVDRLIDGSKLGCVLTDPPYGINLDTDWSEVGGSEKALLKGTPGGKYRPVEGDDVPFDAGLLYQVFEGVREQFWFGADYYRRTIPAADLDGSWLVWDKRSEEADGVFGSGFELIWSKQRHKRDLLRVFWSGAFGDAEARGRVHPTQKPTKLLAEILERWAPSGCGVVDPFGGSGSTLLAAHQTGRVAYLMELDPKYCDVICKRWQKATGVLPVAESTGNAHDFCEDDA